MNIEATKVQSIENAQHIPGSIHLGKHPETGEILGMQYICPCGCGEEDYVPIGMVGWKWDGNEELPTLSPSLKRRTCGYHGWLKEGIWVKA